MFVLAEVRKIMLQKNLKIILASLGKATLSNCYFSYKEIEKKCNSNQIDVIAEEHIVILIEKKETFHRLYYFLDGVDVSDSIWMKIRKNLLSYELLSAERVERSQECLMPEVLVNLKFRSYKTYIRLSFVNKGTSEYEIHTDIGFATEEDVNAVYELFRCTFDDVSDTLATKEELLEFVNKKQIIKISEQREIAGVLLFEDKGVKSYIRMLCVDAPYRNKGIGYELVKEYFNIHRQNTKLFYLWVDADNQSAINLYNHFGYTRDGLVNYIYVRD